MDETLKKAAQLFKVKEVDQEKKQIRFIMSTPVIDRHGEVVDQDGWDFKAFMENPVVLWAHDHYEPAIGQVVVIEKVNGNTEGVVQFAYDENEKAKTIFELCAGKYIRACSVGFRNKKWQYDEENDILTLLENELFELSIVNIPANPEAIAKMKSKGLDASFIMDEQAAREDRFKGLGVQVPVAKSADEPGDETPEEEEKPEEVPSEGSPSVEPEETESPDEEVAKAIEVLVKASPTKIKEAVEALTGKLQVADTNEKTVDETPAPQGRKNKISTNELNRVIRNMLKSTTA